jgi:predicted lipid-binding transport protein (Tim44 family)
MSGQLIELIIFAGIAFFIINKLIATLGSTSEEEQTGKNGKSFFGSNAVRDVTSTSMKKASILKTRFSKKFNLKGLVVEGTEKEIEKELLDVVRKLPNFDLDNFIKGAKGAFQMIIKSGTNTDSELESLIDKRYLDHFRSISSSYGEYLDNDSKLTAQISEIYTFGNNVFIKVLFTGEDITNKIKQMHEEWTFTKTTLNASPAWYLTNIDRPQ